MRTKISRRLAALAIGFALIQASLAGARTILDGSGLTGSTGIRVEPATGSTALTSFTLEGLTIRNNRLTGVLVRTDGDRLVGSRYENNHEYGPFPIFSTDGFIGSNDVSGSDDACIYIGRSEGVVIRDNVVTRCLTGIQIKNSERLGVSRNIVTDSSLGNGSAPDPRIAPLPGADLWDLSGADNCWATNVATSVFPTPLPDCEP